MGIRPPTDRDGCLQDVHWPSGAFGYFPSYTIGAIAAAQLFAAALSAHPEIPSELARGELGSLRAFAREHVHQHGSRFDTNAILERATGRGLDVGRPARDTCGGGTWGSFASLGDALALVVYPPSPWHGSSTS